MVVVAKGWGGGGGGSGGGDQDRQVAERHCHQMQSTT